MGTKITRDFLNQDGNKHKFYAKSRLWNNKNKNKNTTRVKQKFNKIVLQKRNKNKTKLWQRNVFKICVEKINGDRIFYLDLYPLGT
jgi:hypothetical protein